VGRPSRGIAQGRPGTTRRRDCQRRHPGRTGTRKRRDTGRRLRYPANSSEKFRDYLFTLYPDLEEEENRVSPTSLRTGENSPPAALKVARSSHSSRSFGRSTRKSQASSDASSPRSLTTSRWAAPSATTSTRAESAADLTADDYAQLREDVRNALYQEVPGFESIQTIADLERLCALAARNRGLSRSGIRTSSNCSMSTGERSPIATFPRWQSCTC